MMTVSSLHEESPMSTATEFGMSPEDAPDSKPPHARNGAATDSGGSGGDAQGASNDSGGSPWRGLARDLLKLSQEQVLTFAREQSVRGAERLDSVAGLVQRSGEDIGSSVPAVADYSQQAAKRIEHLAAELRRREPMELYAELNRAVRRYPAASLIGAATIGFLAARFLKSGTGARV